MRLPPDDLDAALQNRARVGVPVADRTPDGLPLVLNVARRDDEAPQDWKSLGQPRLLDAKVADGEPHDQHEPLRRSGQAPGSLLRSATSHLIASATSPVPVSMSS